MSWSAFYNEIEGKFDEFVVPPIVESDHVKEQFDQAVRAALTLIESRVLGVGVKFNVSLHGHANPGHAPTPGWANDCVTVSVNQATPADPPAVDVPVEAPVAEENVSPPPPLVVEVAPEVDSPAPDPAPPAEVAPSAAPEGS